MMIILNRNALQGERTTYHNLEYASRVHTFNLSMFVDHYLYLYLNILNYVYSYILEVRSIYIATAYLRYLYFKIIIKKPITITITTISTTTTSHTHTHIYICMR